MPSQHVSRNLQPVIFLAVLALVILAGCSDGGDGLTVGDTAPNFSLPDASGSTVSLDDYAGAPALLYFHMADG